MKLWNRQKSKIITIAKDQSIFNCILHRLIKIKIRPSLMVDLHPQFLETKL